METIKNDKPASFQWVKPKIAFFLHDGRGKELNCNVANIIPFMNLFDMILQLFSHNFLTLTGDTMAFAGRHNLFLAPGDHTDKTHHAPVLLKQGTNKCALALLTNNLFPIDVAGQKLKTYKIPRNKAGKPSTSDIDKAIQASLDKVKNIIQPDEYAKWYDAEDALCSWFCDLGIKVFPKDTNYILAPKATPAASKKFCTTMIVNEPH
jgi:hypothetical protein